MNLKALKLKVNEYLESKITNSNILVEIIKSFENSIKNNESVSAYILAIEQIFTEILKKKEMCIEIKPLKPIDSTPENQYRTWLLERYKESTRLILLCFDLVRQSDGTQALATAMRLLCLEGKYPIETNIEMNNSFPGNRLRNIMMCLLSSERSNNHLMLRFKEYGGYLDVLFYAWKLLPGLTPKKGAPPCDIYIQNYLDFISSIPITTEVQDAKEYFCAQEGQHSIEFNYLTVRKCLNKAWNCAILWTLSETTHKQILIVLLEKMLPHLDKPVLLTDFLMDSLDAGGPISLLALQGVFTLIQKHNLTYPNIYEKLYSMFEPEIFHTKFKARLFYLADIFLSSSHLPESLVAAFVKRLARLSLVAPPQDIVIILYFIGNLILRHPGLKRLICHPHGGEIPQDPYIMDERDPNKSNALESSLWEIATLQNHALPSVVQAAKFISNPLPNTEWDMASFLELSEDDIFDKEIIKHSKQCSLNFERSQSMYLTTGDRFKQYWNLF